MPFILVASTVAYLFRRLIEEASIGINPTREKSDSPCGSSTLRLGADCHKALIKAVSGHSTKIESSRDWLITSIILEEKSRSSFSVINFYERRARRILPELSTALFFTTATAFILMPADLLKSYSQSLLSVATFFKCFLLFDKRLFFNKG
jgi:hypothetical protein